MVDWIIYDPELNKNTLYFMVITVIVIFVRWCNNI